MLDKKDKQVLASLVKYHLDEMKAGKKEIFIGVSIPFLKAEHDYQDFLEQLLKKLHG